MKDGKKEIQFSEFQKFTYMQCFLKNIQRVKLFFCEDPFLTHNTSLGYSMPFKESKNLNLHPLITSHIPPGL